ncbi:MAG: acyl carrier protein [Actinomycetota bacterium]|nr:acyl carrier protein [Actinomycetota bacterium]
MNLHDRLEKIFRNVLGNDSIELRDETTAADIEGWDSIAHINLMFSIEQEFGIQFVGNEFAQFTDVGDLKRSLEQKAVG